MPLTLIARVACGDCRTVVVMDADLELEWGTYVVKPRLVNDWRVVGEEYYCSKKCEDEAEKKKPVIQHVYEPPIRRTR